MGAGRGSYEVVLGQEKTGQQLRLGNPMGIVFLDFFDELLECRCLGLLVIELPVGTVLDPPRLRPWFMWAKGRETTRKRRFRRLDRLLWS